MSEIRATEGTSIYISQYQRQEMPGKQDNEGSIHDVPEQVSTDTGRQYIVRTDDGHYVSPEDYLSYEEHHEIEHIPDTERQYIVRTDDGHYVSPEDYHLYEEHHEIEHIPDTERQYIARTDDGHYVAPENHQYEEEYVSPNESDYRKTAQEEAERVCTSDEQYDAYVEMKTNSLILKELVSSENIEELEEFPAIEPQTEAEKRAVEEAVYKANIEIEKNNIPPEQAKSYRQVRVNNAITYQNMLDTDFSQFKKAIEENIKKYSLHVGGIYSNQKPDEA